MKHKTNQLVVFLFSFVLFFSFFYCSVTAWRNHSLNVLIEEHSGISKEEKTQHIAGEIQARKEYLQSLELGFPNDSIFSDPVFIDYMSTEYSRLLKEYLGYYCDTLPTIIEEPQQNPLGRFFHVYGRYYSYMSLRVVIRIGFLLPDLQLADPNYESCAFTKMTAAISVWKDEGNSLEGEWIDRFLESPQYQNLLAEILSETEYPEGEKSVTSMAQEILDTHTNESLNPERQIRNVFLSDAKEFTQIAFHSYEQHKLEGDFVLAYLDAKTIELLHAHVMDAQTLDPLHYHEFNSEKMLPNFYIDVTGVMILSLGSAVATAYFYKRRDRKPR